MSELMKTLGQGNVVFTVADAAARAQAEENKKQISTLYEEIDEIKESGAGGGTNWGARNAGKVLVTDGDGNTLPAAVGEGLELSYGVGKNIFHGEWENAQYTKGAYVSRTDGRNYAAVKELFPVTPNTAYTISRQTAPASAWVYAYFQEFDYEGNWLEGSSVISGFNLELVKVTHKTLVTGPNTHYLGVYLYGESPWQDLIPGEVMIEKGSKATEYEPYSEENAVLGLWKDEIPAYWKDHINGKINDINSLHKQLGKDCFSFVCIADMHYNNNLGKRSPHLAKKIMDECDIKYTYVLGDLTTSGSIFSESEIVAECVEIENMLAPFRSRALIAQGNHDGAWGWIDDDGNGTAEKSELWKHNFTPGEMHKWLFRKVGLVGDVHFDESGTAYYIDDTANRVRFITLNTSCLDYETNADGSAKYNTMKMFRFTQKQYDFLLEALVDGLDERWNIVIGAHAPLVAYEDMWGSGDNVEYKLMRDFLTAFRDKTSFSGTFAGTADNGFDAVTVSADFTAAKANLVGYFAGHIHDDYHYAHANYGIDMIGIAADRQREGMTANTDTEQSFDVITVDTKTKKIYCTKIGFGNDREISYA